MLEPVAFFIGKIPIYWYGIMVACGFIAATLHLGLLGKRCGHPFDKMPDAYLLWLMIGGIIGARITYVIANFEDFKYNLSTIIRVDQGGLIFYGGVVGAIIAGLILSKIRKDLLLPTFDFFLTALPLGHTFGRIGCLLRGCCYGKETDCWCGIHLYGETIARYPAQLFEALGNLAIYVLLTWFFMRKKISGVVTALYMLLYGTLRFCNEFLRGDERERLLSLSIAQWISLVMIVGGSAMLWLVQRKQSSINIR